MDGAPLSGCQVVFDLVTNDPETPGWRADKAHIAGRILTTTNASGVWTVDLEPNSGSGVVLPAGTAWRVVERLDSGIIYFLSVPDTAGPHQAKDLLVSAPTTVITWASTAYVDAAIAGLGGGMVVGGDLTGTTGNAQIAAGAVGTAELAAGAVTAVKVAADVATQAELDAVAAGIGATVAATAVGGDLTGTVANAQIAALAVGTAELAANAVTAAKVAADVATQAELDAVAAGVGGTAVGGDLTGTVANAQIAALAVGTAELAAGAVTAAKVAADVATQAELDAVVAAVPATVTGTAVGGDLTGTVGNAQIAALAVGTAELAANAVTAAKVAADVATQAELDANATADRARANHTGTQTASTISDFASVAGATTVGGDLTGTVANAQIGATAVGFAELSAFETPTAAHERPAWLKYNRGPAAGYWYDHAATRMELGRVRTPEDHGAVGDGVANDITPLRNLFTACQPGDTIYLAPGKVYRYTDTSHLHIADKDGITIVGRGARFHAATPAESGFQLEDCNDWWVDGLTLTADLSSLGVPFTGDYRGTGLDHHRFSLYNSDNFTGVGMRVDGSYAAGVFVISSENAYFIRPVIRNTRADGFHMTGASRYITLFQPTIINPGDDGVAVVSYDGDTAQVQYVWVDGARVWGQYHGRGMSVVGGADVWYTNTEVLGSRAAGIYIGSEDNGSYITKSTQRIVVSGGRLVGCNQLGATEAHGAVFLLNQANAATGRVVNDIEISNLHIHDVPRAAVAPMNLKNSGSTGDITNVRAYGNHITGRYQVGSIDGWVDKDAAITTPTTASPYSTGAAATRVEPPTVIPESALLDRITVSPTMALGLRKLRAAYTGSAIRVRRSSDNAESDIGFTTAGDLDLAAIYTFVGPNSAYVTTWYDQSGNGRNATQTTGSLQPRIVSAGVIEVKNRKPILTFDGTDDYLTGTTNLATTAATASVVAYHVAGGAPNANARFLSVVSTAGALDYDSPLRAAMMYRNGSTTSITAFRGGSAQTLAYDTLATVTSLYDGTNHTMRVNQSPGSGVADSGTFGSTIVRMGWAHDAPVDAHFIGGMVEVIIWNSGLSAGNLNILESNQRVHIGTP